MGQECTKKKSSDFILHTDFKIILNYTLHTHNLLKLNMQYGNDPQYETNP